MVKTNNTRDDNMQQLEKSKSVKYEDTFGLYHYYQPNAKLIAHAILYSVISAMLIALPSLLNLNYDTILIPSQLNAKNI